MRHVRPVPVNTSLQTKLDRLKKELPNWELPTCLTPDNADFFMETAVLFLKAHGQNTQAKIASLMQRLQTAATKETEPDSGSGLQHGDPALVGVVDVVAEFGKLGPPPEDISIEWTNKPESPDLEMLRQNLESDLNRPEEENLDAELSDNANMVAKVEPNYNILSNRPFLLRFLITPRLTGFLKEHFRSRTFVSINLPSTTWVDNKGNLKVKRDTKVILGAQCVNTKEGSLTVDFERTHSLQSWQDPEEHIYSQPRPNAEPTQPFRWKTCCWCTSKRDEERSVKIPLPLVDTVTFFRMLTRASSAMPLNCYSCPKPIQAGDRYTFCCGLAEICQHAFCADCVVPGRMLGKGGKNGVWWLFCLPCAIKDVRGKGIDPEILARTPVLVNKSKST